MAAKTISQKKFAKLVASTGALSQPPGALTRISNLLFTQRGSLQISDGSLSIALVSSLYSAILSLASFDQLTPGLFPSYSALALNPTPQLTTVTNFVPTLTTGSANPAAHYFFGIVATFEGGHSDIGPTVTQVTSVVPTGGASFTWTAVAGATGYQIWLVSLSPPNPGFNGTLVASVGAVTSYTFTGVFPYYPVPLPFGNVSNLLQLFTSLISGSSIFFTPVSAGNWAAAPVIGASLAPGAPNFNYSTPIPGFSPYGGIAGVACPIPQQVQFAGRLILILGNGLAPQSYVPGGSSTAPVISLTNNFTAAYPTWQAAVAWVTGAQLTASNGTTNFLFTATQGGVSGTPTAPSWNFTTNGETSDGSVIWTCNGPIPASVAPIGAAHAVAYAGSLWLANTWPYTTQYAIWDSLTTYVVGTQIAVIDGSGNTWLFVVSVGGVSDVSQPSWTFSVGATTTDGTVTWNCSVELSPALAAGIDGPSCLKMSDASNSNSWNPVNTAFIGKDDGTQITGLQPFTIAALGISPTGSLCVFKEFTTYQVIGVFGSTSFEIQPAQTNLGCIASRSIQFLPGFGVCRFSHLGFAVFDGINDRLISEDIRPYLFGGVDSETDLVPVDSAFLYRSVSAQTISPPMYLCAMPLSGSAGAMTRLFVYDLVMKAWAVLDLPWAINSLATMAVGEGYPLVLAGKSDGTVQRMQSGDLTWDAGASDQSNVAWSFRSPDVFGEGSSQRLFYEQATIRGYGSAAMVKSIIANLWLDGQQLGSQGIDVVPQGGSNLFEARVSLFRSGYRAHIDFSGNNGGAAGVIDSIDWAVTPKSALARRIIS